jgi:hypothetical protein
MPVTVRAIEWSPMPRTPHGVIGTVRSRYGVRRVAGIICENDNPRRPKGSPLLARPFTLELYIPLLGGQDRILKFNTLAEAERGATQAVLRFINDLIEEQT